MARLLVAVTAAIAFSAVGHAQNQSDQSPASDSSQPDAQEPVFRSSVTLATTDLIARDDDGLFIADLGLEDLTVYEDGQKQEIASLVLVHGGQVYNRLLPQAPVQEGIILPGERAADTTSGRVFIIFVDDMHLETSLTPKVRQVFKKLIETVIHEGDLFGVISSGPSALNIDMTHDRSLLYSAMEKITGDGFSPRQYIKEMQGGSNGPMEIRWRVHKAFKLARQIIDNLEQLKHRRKAFLYVSSGYDFNPYQMERLRESPAGQFAKMLGSGEEADSYYREIPDSRLRQLQEMIEPATTFADTDLAAELGDLARAANRANATFYTVDPRGLVASPDLDYDVPLMEWNSHLSQTQFTMRFLAELTGGFAVVNTNNFEGGFERIDAETSDYYIIGFHTNNPDPSNRTRRLRIEVNRPGVNVRHRTHYTYSDSLDQEPVLSPSLNP